MRFLWQVAGCEKRQPWPFAKQSTDGNAAGFPGRGAHPAMPHMIHSLFGRRAPPAPVFILGTGRSGTHWLAESLGSEPALAVTLEVQPRFGWSTTMALDQRRRQDLLGRLINNYRLAQWWHAPRRLVDKAHPNIWLAESLLEAFPGASFLGIQRQVHATVASMVRCPPVMAWHRRWRDFPVPNRFLGISRAYAERYDSLSAVERCTLRWLAHRDRMRELRPILGDRLLVVCYEEMMDDVLATLERVASFIGFKRGSELPAVRSESRSKWQQVLSPEDVDAIDAIVAEWDRAAVEKSC